MFGRKLYKTKLCILYQRGRCNRQNCNFAHGDAELRRFGGSFNGRRDSRGGDLRDKLDRRHSPHRRYSPDRDARGHHSFHNQKPISYDRGSSISRSPIKRSERKHKKKQSLGGDSDASEDFKISDGSEDRKKEQKSSSHDDKGELWEQLKQIQLDIDILDDHKSQLEISLLEEDDEEHKLSSRIQDLESQLKKEQEKCTRITSNIEKFNRAYGRYMKTKELLKRVEARMQKYCDEISSDAIRPSTNEDDSCEIVASDKELNGDRQISPRNEGLLTNVLSTRKRTFGYPTSSEEGKTGDTRKRERHSGYGGSAQQDNISKGSEPRKALTRSKSSAEKSKHKRGKSGSTETAYLGKVKASEVRHSLPSTSIAAYAVDELTEAIEMDEKYEDLEANKFHENGDVENGTKSAYIPPPPPALTAKEAYKQYEGDDDKEVDVEKVDNEMLDIDLNSEVDIEQM